jgi:hypothetical protein
LTYSDSQWHRANIRSGGEVADAIARLGARFRGDVIRPGHPSYERAARVWNAAFDVLRPAAVLRCVDEDDVVTAMRAVRESGVPVAVRGGGHHVAGFGSCDGGFVIDLELIRNVVAVDHRCERLRVGGGATLHEIDTVTAAFGRAVPLGTVSKTGIGGLTLSGGIGWLTRRHGYTCDNLVSARVVTPSAEVVIASEDENADLLWGLRGGGGNFGIVTEFEFRTHDAETVETAEAYRVVDDESDFLEALAFYRKWTLGLSESATVWLSVEHIAPFHHMLPEQAWGRLAVCFLACTLDVSPEGRRELDALLEWAPDGCARRADMRLIDLQHVQDSSNSAADGMYTYMKGEMLTSLTDIAISGISKAMMSVPTSNSLFEMGMLGGALGAHDDADGAVGMRDAQYLAGFSMMSTESLGFEQHTAWAREARECLMGNGSAGGVYLNFNGAEPGDQVLGSLGASRGSAKRARLIRLKRQFDPGNLLRRNHNIDPCLREDV